MASISSRPQCVKHPRWPFGLCITLGWIIKRYVLLLVAYTLHSTSINDIEWECFHDDVIKWKLFRVTGHLCGEFTGHRWIPLRKGLWGGAFMFSLICAWINGWVNNRDTGDLRRHCAHYDVTVMFGMLPVWPTRTGCSCGSRWCSSGSSSGCSHFRGRSSTEISQGADRHISISNNPIEVHVQSTAAQEVGIPRHIR